MNDRYLFKAKKKNWQELPKDEQWVQGYLFDDGFENGRMFVGGLVVEKYTGTACDDWAVTGINFYEIDLSTICQCTGLKDKNGKLIWENDICDRKEQYPEIVKYCNGDWTLDCSYAIHKESGGCYCNLGFYVEERKCVEVIGNIFDNKELLESEEQYGENI